tara:strand:+ start:60 stop:752 length:693 start_codon:yes stop_codon:yes gene_type:complete
MLRLIFLFALSQVMIGCTLLSVDSSSEDMPDNFIDVGDFINDIIIDARYASTNNFTGKQVTGYHANKCFLTKEAAKALNKVQHEAQKHKMTLKVYDCYRPQQSVDQFIAWTEDLSDQSTKTQFYPNIEKETLLGPYIAEKSGHSTGNTIDLTVVLFDEEGGVELDMGSDYDLFDPISHTKTDLITSKQQENRFLLKNIMEQFNFLNYELEWWHFSFQSTDTALYYNFPVK